MRIYGNDINMKTRSLMAAGFVSLSKRNLLFCDICNDQCSYWDQRHKCKTAYKVNNRYEESGQSEKEKELGLFLQSIVEENDAFYS